MRKRPGGALRYEDSEHADAPRARRKNAIERKLRRRARPLKRLAVAARGAMKAAGPPFPGSAPPRCCARMNRACPSSLAVMRRRHGSPISRRRSTAGRNPLPPRPSPRNVPRPQRPRLPPPTRRAQPRSAPPQPRERHRDDSGKEQGRLRYEVEDDKRIKKRRPAPGPGLKVHRTKPRAATHTPPQGGTDRPQLFRQFFDNVPSPDRPDGCVHRIRVACIADAGTRSATSRRARVERHVRASAPKPTA